jgi:two-component system, response regulator FlrC
MTSPAVLIVEDDPYLREALLSSLGRGEHPVFAAGSGSEALEILKAHDIGLLVSDLQMQPMDGHELLGRVRQQHPALPAVFMSAYGTFENAVNVMRNGAVDFLVKPFEIDDLKSIIDRFLRHPVAGRAPVAADPCTVELLRIARQVAATDATLTISGESGCGKEVFARYVHRQSSRSSKPFVAINCAAIPENMLEAVLFGYEKGAFTGANVAHAGKFEQAQGGTLLLDEISEMNLGLQAKLLRVIQEKEVERLGGRCVIPLDVRVLATTNRDLRKCVDERSFREDLYYRLNVFPLHILPLRERRGDILPLALLAIRKHTPAGRIPPALTPDAEQKLTAHRWPGNVRELENVIQRALILAQGNVIDSTSLVLDETGDTNGGARDPAAALQDDLKQHEHELIVETLRDAGGNRTAVAKKLGISPRTLRYKLARMRADGFDARCPGAKS